MKIGLIAPSNRWRCPFVEIYTKLLDQHGFHYDVITWNRDGSEDFKFQYNARIESTDSFLKKAIQSLKFSSYVKRVINSEQYERLIIFTPQTGILLFTYLFRKYRRKYILDYRDLSIEQKPVLSQIYSKLLSQSFANIISSPGFRRYLPDNYNYIISNNFNIEQVNQSLLDNCQINTETNAIDILTIGGIRDYESNVQIIDSIANKDGFTLRFVGKGPSAAALQKHAHDINAQNVTFEGYYQKEKEREYIASCSFLNIYYPRKASHDTALSNRFYNSLIYKKPMITTADTTQGDYTVKYGVGVAIPNCERLDEILKQYLENFNTKQYISNCNNLLKSFISDYQVFETTIISFLE